MFPIVNGLQSTWYTQFRMSSTLPIWQCQAIARTMTDSGSLSLLLSLLKFQAESFSLPWKSVEWPNAKWIRRKLYSNDWISRNWISKLPVSLLVFYVTALHQDHAHQKCSYSVNGSHRCLRYRKLPNSITLVTTAVSLTGKADYFAEPIRTMFIESSLKEPFGQRLDRAFDLQFFLFKIFIQKFMDPSFYWLHQDR